MPSCSSKEKHDKEGTNPKANEHDLPTTLTVEQRSDPILSKIIVHLRREPITERTLSRKIIKQISKDYFLDEDGVLRVHGAGGG